MTTPVAARFLVTGRVQGVFFRASTREAALKLQLTGYARNLPDGRVEVLAFGEPDAVQGLLDWLWRGSPASEVKFVDVQELALDDLEDLPVGFAQR